MFVVLHGRRVSALGSLSFALRAALRAVALSHARLRTGVTRELSAKLTEGEIFHSHIDIFAHAAKIAVNVQIANAHDC